MSTVLAKSIDVENAGPGFMFQVQKDGQLWSAFVIRYEDEALCYLNACAHVGLKLNGNSNELFDRSGETLLCRAHGASYQAADGKCKDGPCQGFGLIPLAIKEENGSIYYEDTNYIFYEPER